MDRYSTDRAALLPDLGKDIQRSSFVRPFSNKFTLSAGQLIPFHIDEVLPGDTFSLDMASVTRMATPIFPVMDSCYLDTFFFFCPSRILWDHWKEFMGEASDAPWVPSIKYSVPQVKSGIYSNFGFGSIADYMGVPVGPNGYIPNMSVSALPFRAYVKIWNEWFRDQNLMNPAYCPTGDEDYELTTDDIVGYVNGWFSYYGSDNYSLDSCLTDAYKGTKLLPVSKYKDYFTSALPQPQRGDAVRLPLMGDAPVYSRNALVDLNLINNSPFGIAPVMFARFDNGSVDGVNYPLYSKTEDGYTDSQGNTGNVGILNADISAGSSTNYSNDNALNVRNLWADLSQVSAATINDLRLAFQTQRFLEKQALGGSRYREQIWTMFNVKVPDSTMQIPEYLGGQHIPINIDQVVQTSSTDSASPQGNVSAFSYTQNRDSVFTKSFTEHGYIIGVCCVRTNNTYQYGLHRMWSRRSMLDYYFPVFAHLGEQPILNKEIYYDGSGEGDNDGVFGYQEAWAEYRYGHYKLTGQFRSNYPQSLDAWHYAENYNSMPYLGADFIVQKESPIDRTIAVPSEPQFICDTFINCTSYRPMPMYSIPGLIDHF